MLLLLQGEVSPDLKPPIVVQQFVEHGGVLYKVGAFWANGRMYCDGRAATFAGLPNGWKLDARPEGDAPGAWRFI